MINFSDLVVCIFHILPSFCSSGQDVLDDLRTPGNKGQQEQDAETPLTEVIKRNLKAAVANSLRPNTHPADLGSSPQLSKEQQRTVSVHTCPHVSHHPAYLLIQVIPVGIPLLIKELCCMVLGTHLQITAKFGSKLSAA